MTHEPDDAVLDFYDTHPISETQILDKLRAAGADLDALTEDILQDHDQDHFGGLDANKLLADKAKMGAGDHALDICCGLGGPARWMAVNRGCRVTGVDMTESRIAGAKRLTEMCRLADRVDFTRGNALDLPCDDAAFDVAYSQEAFCHIPDKDALIAQCARVLKPGGRLVFTDILATARTRDRTLERLNSEMTFNDLSTANQYGERLEAAGFQGVEHDDLGEEWRTILVDRLAMYRRLRDQTVGRFGEAHFDKWDRAYSFFVSHYATGELSGGRFFATRKG